MPLDLDKLAAVKNIELPAEVGGARRLSENNVGQFLPHDCYHDWVWGLAQQVAFQKLKDMTASNICMANYNPLFSTIVSVDSSSLGLGAVLLQDQPSGER